MLPSTLGFFIDRYNMGEVVKIIFIKHEDKMHKRFTLLALI
jgi:hypothetical protein